MFTRDLPFPKQSSTDFAVAVTNDSFLVPLPQQCPSQFVPTLTYCFDTDFNARPKASAVSVDLERVFRLNEKLTTLLPMPAVPKPMRTTMSTTMTTTLPPNVKPSDVLKQVPVRTVKSQNEYDASENSFLSFVDTSQNLLPPVPQIPDLTSGSVEHGKSVYENVPDIETIFVTKLKLNEELPLPMPKEMHEFFAEHEYDNIPQEAVAVMEKMLLEAKEKEEEKEKEQYQTFVIRNQKK
jgi:hypothetical protein